MYNKIVFNSFLYSGSLGMMISFLIFIKIMINIFLDLYFIDILESDIFFFLSFIEFKIYIFKVLLYKKFDINE